MKPTIRTYTSLAAVVSTMYFPPNSTLIRFGDRSTCGKGKRASECAADILSSLRLSTAVNLPWGFLANTERY